MPCTQEACSNYLDTDSRSDCWPRTSPPSPSRPSSSSGIDFHWQQRPCSLPPVAAYQNHTDLTHMEDSGCLASLSAAGCSFERGWSQPGHRHLLLATSVGHCRGVVSAACCQYSVGGRREVRSCWMRHAAGSGRLRAPRCSASWTWAKRKPPGWRSEHLPSVAG